MEPEPDDDDNDKSDDGDDKPDGIPKNWIEKDSLRGGEKRWIDPKNSSNNVRKMPGNPNSPYPAQRKPYVKHMKNGRFLDKNGNPVQGDSPEAHIPLDDFVFR